MNCHASVACRRNWQYELAFPSAVALTCHFWWRPNMPRKISWCVSLLGCQLLSEGSSEFFPANREDLWAFNYCRLPRNYKGPRKGHFFHDSILSILYGFDCMHWLRVDTCRNPSSWGMLFKIVSRKWLTPQFNIIACDRRSCRKEVLYRSSEAEQEVNSPKTSETQGYLPESLYYPPLGRDLDSWKSCSFYIYTRKCLLYIVLI